MFRGNQEGRQASSWEPAVLDFERDIGRIGPKQAIGHPSRGSSLERVQTGLRTHTPVHEFCALDL